MGLSSLFVLPPPNIILHPIEHRSASTEAPLVGFGCKHISLLSQLIEFFHLLLGFVFKLAPFDVYLHSSKQVGVGMGVGSTSVEF